MRSAQRDKHQHVLAVLARRVGLRRECQRGRPRTVGEKDFNRSKRGCRAVRIRGDAPLAYQRGKGDTELPFGQELADGARVAAQHLRRLRQI